MYYYTDRVLQLQSEFQHSAICMSYDIADTANERQSSIKLPSFIGVLLLFRNRDTRCSASLVPGTVLCSFLKLLKWVPWPLSPWLKLSPTFLDRLFCLILYTSLGLLNLQNVCARLPMLCTWSSLKKFNDNFPHLDCGLHLVTLSEQCSITGRKKKT